MTLSERTVCSAYTGVMFFDTEEWIRPIMEYAYHLFNKPIGIYEIRSNDEFWKDLHSKSYSDFLKVLRGEPIDFQLEKTEVPR